MRICPDRIPGRSGATWVKELRVHRFEILINRNLYFVPIWKVWKVYAFKKPGLDSCGMNCKKMKQKQKWFGIYDLYFLKGIIPAKIHNLGSVQLNQNSFSVKQFWALIFYQNLLIKNQFFYVLKVKIRQICNCNQTLRE